MSKNADHRWIYRFLDSEKQTEGVLKDIIDRLESEYPRTIWNIAYIVESTAKLCFIKHGQPFDVVKDTVREMCGEKKRRLLKKDVPKGYKWMLLIPLEHDGQNYGVLMCLGLGKASVIRDDLAEDMAFFLQHYRLKEKLIKDTILLNTIIMSSQSTASSKNIDPLISMLVPHLNTYLKTDWIRVLMKENDGFFTYDEFGVKQVIEVPEERSIINSVFQTGRPLMIKDAFSHEDFNPEVDVLTGKAKIVNLIAAPIMVKDEVGGMVIAANNDLDSVFVGSDLVWVKSVCGEIGATLERLNLYHDIHKLFLSSVEALASAIEGKDPYTHGHSRRVTMFALMIAGDMNLESDLVEQIRLSSLLHDIGKIAVPEFILMKQDKLTDEEWKILKQHPYKGAAILEPVVEFKPLLDGIKHHHERYDGDGYPAGLSGNDIPLIARIISVADAFDAMTSERVYRKAMPEEKALEEIKKCRAKQFDPGIADIFVDVYREKFYAKSV